MTTGRAATIRKIIDSRRTSSESFDGDLIVVQNRVPYPKVKTMSGAAGGSGGTGAVHTMDGGSPAHTQPLHQRSAEANTKTMQAIVHPVKTAPLPPATITVPNATIAKVEALEKATFSELTVPGFDTGKVNARCAIFLNNRRPIQSWGDEDALALSSLADFQLDVTRFMTDADAPQLMDRTRQYYTTPPTPPKRSFWNSFAPLTPPPVIDFKSALQADLVVLNDVCVKVKDKLVDVEDRINRLTLDQAIVTAAAKVVAGIDQAAASSRARSLLAVIQTAGMIRQALVNLHAMATKQQEQVDHFLTVLIPQWTLSRGLSSAQPGPGSGAGGLGHSF